MTFYEKQDKDWKDTFWTLQIQGKTNAIKLSYFSEVQKDFFTQRKINLELLLIMQIRHN